MTQLSTSDFLGIVLTLIGVIGGTFVSWLFFRAQQSTDFRKVSESIDSIRAVELSEINSSLAVIKSAKDIHEQLQIRDSVTSLKEMIAKLDKEIDHLPEKIALSFGIEQRDLMDRITIQFNRKVDESSIAIEQSIRKAVSKAIPINQQHEVLREVTELLKYSMMTMGKYQLEILQNESERSLYDTTETIKNAVKPVASEVNALQLEVNGISQTALIER